MAIWKLQNFTCFDVFTGFDRDQFADAYWCVWIKVGFVIGADGRVGWNPAAQRKILHAPDMSDTVEGLLIDDTDIVLLKGGTDILVSASSLPPNSDQIEPFLCSVNIGGWSKTVQVHPPQIWIDKEGVSTLAACSSIALDYAHAFGGTAQNDNESDVFEDNPLGLGHASKHHRIEKLELPIITYPDEQWRQPGDVIRPAAFGAIPRSWRKRANLAGTFDANWRQTRSPILPKDYDPEHRFAAPEDQRVDGYLNGGERISYLNISGLDAYPAPAFQLPNLVFGIEVKRDSQWNQLEASIETLHLWPGEGRLTMTYCAAMKLHHAADDVAISETEVWIKHAGGFFVRPEHVPSFQGSIAAEEPEL